MLGRKSGGGWAIRAGRLAASMSTPLIIHSQVFIDILKRGDKAVHKNNSVSGRPVGWQK